MIMMTLPLTRLMATAAGGLVRTTIIQLAVLVFPDIAATSNKYNTSKATFADDAHSKHNTEIQLDPN